MVPGHNPGLHFIAIKDRFFAASARVKWVRIFELFAVQGVIERSKRAAAVGLGHGGLPSLVLCLVARAPVSYPGVVAVNVMKHQALL